MFKSYHKLKTSVIGSAFLASALALTACGADEAKGTAEKAVKTAASTAVAASEKVATAAKTAVAGVSSKSGVSHVYANGKKVIDGGVTYPVTSGKTAAYYVNTQEKKDFKNGRPATKNEIAAWNIDVMPDGTGLPEGKGTVEQGDEIYEDKCVICHGDFGSGGGGYPALSKGNAQEGFESLTNQRLTPDSDGPVRVFGSYWPQASTLWWYIKTGMPHPAPLSLTDDQVYALCAYILSINEMSIDGVELDDDYELDRAKFMKIVMPNKDGFEPKIDGPKGTDNVREYFNDFSNYGNGTRCMHDCFEGDAKLARIQIEMKNFLPPMSVKRELPPKGTGTQAAALPGQKVYEKACAVCHATDAMGAPVVGDKEEWAKRVAKGIDVLDAHALQGFNGMPAKGGNMDLSDDEVKEVVNYMIEKSK